MGEALDDVLTGERDGVPNPEQRLEDPDVASVVGADERISALVGTGG